MVSLGLRKSRLGREGCSVDARDVVCWRAKDRRGDFGDLGEVGVFSKLICG